MIVTYQEANLAGEYQVLASKEIRILQVDFVVRDRGRTLLPHRFGN
jgi:hypothetical protein